MRGSEFPEALIEGYHRFKDGHYREARHLYRRLAEQGQSPQTMVIACSDSRSAPETIFNASPGTLFVVRNVANLVPPYEPNANYSETWAALEFGIVGLTVSEILVLGHSGCGGIHAARKPENLPLSPANFLGKWIKLLAPAMSAVQDASHLTDAEHQTALEHASIRNSINNLQTFPEVRSRLEKGELRMHGAWFNVAEGELWVLHHSTGDFSKVS